MNKYILVLELLYTHIFREKKMKQKDQSYSNRPRHELILRYEHLLNLIRILPLCFNQGLGANEKGTGR